jgi:hypothetical protein
MEILSKLKPFRRLITWLQNGGYLTSTYQFGSRKISVSVSMSGWKFPDGNFSSKYYQGAWSKLGSLDLWIIWQTMQVQEDMNSSL